MEDRWALSSAYRHECSAILDESRALLSLSQHSTMHWLNSIEVHSLLLRALHVGSDASAASDLKRATELGASAAEEGGGGVGKENGKGHTAPPTAQTFFFGRRSGSERAVLQARWICVSETNWR